MAATGGPHPYERLEHALNLHEIITIDENEETPIDSRVMFHNVPESSTSKWNHIEDLDTFFSRMYDYHQRHGIYCIVLAVMSRIVVFVFCSLYLTFLYFGLNYDALFKRTKEYQDHKVTLYEAIKSWDEIVASFGWITYSVFSIAMLFLVIYIIKGFYTITEFYEMKQFYNCALKIPDDQLDNVTWHEIQRKVIEVQLEQQMCIHKKELTELDIYHRILRHKNYLVAMINKNVLPLNVNLPFVGEHIFLSRAMQYNIEFILFTGPWSPFENNWHLKEEYKKASNRDELARKLSRRILFIGIFNLIMSPVILTWQIFHFIFNNADAIKREPGFLGMRLWTRFARLYFRHFNELDHELHARLCRAYRPSCKYMNSFSSPHLTIISRTYLCIGGTVCGTYLGLSMVDEDLLNVEHLLGVVSLIGILCTVARTFIPNENQVFCPEQLLTSALAHLHYLPDHWRGQAHTLAVRDQFVRFFQFRLLDIAEAFFSVIITPYVLITLMRGRSLDIVDFFRNFTVNVVGVGDVCSFAQMDIRKHGHPDWQACSQDALVRKTDGEPREQLNAANQYTQAEDGKIELSLIHFTLTNPTWKMPMEVKEFVQKFHERAKKDFESSFINNPIYQSINTVSTLGAGYQSLMNSTCANMFMSQYNMSPLSMNATAMADMRGDHNAVTPTYNQYPPRRGTLCKAEGPLYSEGGLLQSLNRNTQESQMMVQSIHDQISASLNMNQGDTGLEYVAAEMSLSTLYMHELHHRQITRRRGFIRAPSPNDALIWQRPHQTPLAILSSPTTNLPPIPSGVVVSPNAGASTSINTPDNGDQFRLNEGTPLLKKNQR